MRAKHYLVLVVALYLGALGTARPAAAQMRYTLMDLGTLGGSESAAMSISDTGLVTGWSATESGDIHVFVYDGTMNDTGLQGIGQDINNRGEIVGQNASDGITYTFVYDGAVHIIGYLPRAYTPGFSWCGINNSGQVAYTAGDPNGDPNADIHAYVYDGATRELGSFGGAQSGAYAISDNGLVTGFAQVGTLPGDPLHAFLYDGEMHDLGTPDNVDLDSGGRAINSSGQVTGAYTNPLSLLGLPLAFFYDGTMHRLGTLGGEQSCGYGINDSGQVVGGADAMVDGLSHAFLYTDGQMYDLNSLVDPVPGWTLICARDINNSGWITGLGLFEGAYRAYLLVPVPEPSSALAMAAGLSCLAGLFRIRRK